MSLPTQVLIVEDNPMIAMNTEVMLLDLGVEDVRTAGNVADALALIEDIRFDFAILDVLLADGEDSLPVAERLGDAGVPIVLATGLDEDSALPDAYKAIPMLKKPYGFDDLKGLLGG
jgi:DNA-binding response OmpR family regulator